jgi:GPN-loop GTPase
VRLSSVTGDDVKESFEAVEETSTESKLFSLFLVSHLYLTSNTIGDYLPELRKARAQRKISLQAVKDDSMNRLLKDLSIDRVQNPSSAFNDRWDSEEEDADEGDMDIIDRCKRGFFDDFFPHFPLLLLAEERGPGDFVDVTRARRHEVEDINWPRPR